ANEAEHKLPWSVGAKNFPGIVRFLGHIQTGHIDLDGKHGRFANTQSIQLQSSIPGFGAFRECGVQALGAEHRRGRGRRYQESHDEWRNFLRGAAWASPPSIDRWLCGATL